MTDTLTPDDLEFLRRPLLGFFTAAAGPVPPQPRPVWFEATDEGTVALFTPPDSVKVRRLAEDPRASFVVAAPADERERWIAITGPVTVDPAGAHELAERLADHYWGPERAADRAELLAQEYVRLVIHPESVRRASY